MRFFNLYPRIRRFASETDPLLLAIMAFAFLIRIVGIAYGLPLTVVADEPPFVLAALQMIQLHTLIPALHPEAFVSILYYPPYVSYIYLLPFIAGIGIKWLVWHGSSALFASYLLSDLSIFFEIARTIMVLLGVVSIYFVYQTAMAIYNSRAAARIAAFLVATSLLDIALSDVGRHWLPVSFLFALVLFILTREQIAPVRRFFYGCLVGGIGIGISTVSFLIIIPLGLWLLLLSDITIKDALKARWIWGGVAVYAALAPIPSLLFSNSQGALAGAFSLFSHKTIAGMLLSPLVALSQTVYSEPVLMGFFFVGLIALWFIRRRWCLFVIGFFLAYVAAFYILFDFQSRFMLPLVLMYALVAPAVYLAVRPYRIAAGIVLLLLVVPLCAAVRLSYLTVHNDTRIMARDWISAHAQPSDKILVYGELFRLQTNAQGVAALRAIDPAAVRKTDLADEALNNPAVPTVLNLYAAHNDAFFENLASYAVQNGYTYLVIESSYASSTGMLALEARGAEVARFEGFGNTTSITASSFVDPLPSLFDKKSLGPTIEIYKLPCCTQPAR